MRRNAAVRGKRSPRMTALHPGMRFVDGAGKPLLGWPRPQDEGPQGWRANYRFHQPDLGKLLRDTLTARLQVTVRTRCEAFYLADTGDHVEIRFDDMTHGKVEHVRAKYVVGRDGAPLYRERHGGLRLPRALARGGWNFWRWKARVGRSQGAILPPRTPGILALMAA